MVETALFLTSLVGAVYAALVSWRIVLGLRAKARVQGALHEFAANDQNLARAIRAIRGTDWQVFPLESNRLLVEQALLKLKISEEDREFIHEGLYQENRRGAVAYLKDVVGT